MMLPNTESFDLIQPPELNRVDEQLTSISSNGESIEVSDPSFLRNQKHIQLNRLGYNIYSIKKDLPLSNIIPRKIERMVVVWQVE
jgi:hypothetical protein